ncbi:MAG: VOC family protein [Alphaproteobacteria bacterium]
MSTQSPQAGQFCWNELLTPDTKKAKEFYGNLLGWIPQEKSVGDMTYTTFMSQDKPVAGMLQCPEGESHIPPHWMSYIYVEDLQATLEKAKTLGADIVRPITVIEGMGSFAVIKDPTGAYISLWQSSEAATC